MAWGDGVFAMMGAYTESSSDDAHPLGVFVRGPTPASRTPTLHDQFGSEMLPTFRAPPLRCEGGHPVLRVRWPDGDAAGVAFDPTHPGTSVDLAAWIDFRSLPMPPHAEIPPTALAWAGAALVGVAEGALLRWACSPTGALRLAPSRAP